MASAHAPTIRILVHSSEGFSTYSVQHSSRSLIFSCAIRIYQVRTCTSSTYLSVGSTNKVETAQYIAFEFNAQHNLAIAKTSERCTVSCIAAAAVVHNTELDNEIHIIAADRSQREEGDTASLRRGDLSLFTTHVIMIGDILPLIWAPRRDRAESRKLLTKHRQLIILFACMCASQ